MLDNILKQVDSKKSPNGGSSLQSAVARRMAGTGKKNTPPGAIKSSEAKAAALKKRMEK